jgi:hypothetical protein
MKSSVDRLRDQLVAAVTTSKPRIPEAGRLVFRWFVDLSLARSYGPHGPNPISYAEIEAWARVTGTPAQPHHVEVLRAMDDAWMAKARDEIRIATGAPASTTPRTSSQSMNPALFDAMFS